MEGGLSSQKMTSQIVHKGDMEVEEEKTEYLREGDGARLRWSREGLDERPLACLETGNLTVSCLVLTNTNSLAEKRERARALRVPRGRVADPESLRTLQDRLSGAPPGSPLFTFPRYIHYRFSFAR